MPCVQSGLVLTGVPALPGAAETPLPAPAAAPLAPGVLESGPELPGALSTVPLVQAAARAAATSNPLRQWNIALTSWVLICRTRFFTTLGQLSRERAPEGLLCFAG